MAQTYQELLRAARVRLEKQKEEKVNSETPKESSQPSAPEENSKSGQMPAEPPELIALLGPPGSGKSETALSILEVPGVERAIALDVDFKMARMDAARPYIDAGRLHILNIYSPLIAGSLETRAQKSQHIEGSRRSGGSGFYTIAPPDIEPKGYLEIMRAMDQADKLISDFKPQAWITDSITRAYEHMHRLISYMTKKGTLEESAWNIALMNGEEFVAAHMKMPAPVRYVILTAHTRTIYDNDKGIQVGVEPEVQGSMRAKLLGYFGEAYFMSPLSDGTYRMCTRLSQFTPARTSKKTLNRFEPANLRVIFDQEYRKEWYESHKPLA